MVVCEHPYVKVLPDLPLGADVFEEGREFPHFVRLCGIEIVLLREVVAKVIKLAGLRVPGVSVGLIEPFGDFADCSCFRGDEHPVAVAERVTVGVRVVDHRVTRAGGIAFDERELAIAVLPGTSGDVCTDDGGNGREDVDLTEDAVVHFACRNDARPADHEGNAVAPFPDVAFQAT